MTIAASLAQYFVEKGRALGFVTYSPYREIVQPDRGPRQLTRILEILAVARSETDLSLRQMLALEANFLGRGTTAVIVTASQDPGWAAEAHTLARRGIRVICVLIDPRSFGALPDQHYALPPDGRSGRRYCVHHSPGRRSDRCPELSRRAESPHLI